MTNPSRFMVSSPGNGVGPQTAINMVENVSLRLKPNSIVPILSIVGLYYALKLTASRKPHYRKREKKELWDFFDPQGHHPIKF